ncbi:MAG: TonB-dependent receptor plug domain-containing protein [Caulobacteraceae bacterium]
MAVVGRAALLSTAAVAAALVAGSQAWAQAASAADAGTGVQEIVVTAERRSENIQTVPLSVSAITGPALQKLGVINFSDYAVMVPSLSFGTGNDYDLSASRQVTIRGVAGTNTTSFYINDTPVPLSLDPRVLDLDRIEVLRGPQGTLFGASAMGGTIRYITRPSDSNSNHGSIDAQAFDVNKGGAGYDISGVYNLALIPDVLSMKVSAFADYQPGIFTREYGIATTPGYTVPASQPLETQKHVGDDRQYGGMVTLTYKPPALPGLTITPMFIYQHDKTNGFPVADYSPDNLVQIRPLNVPQYSEDRWLFGSLSARYDAGFGSFISSTAYFHRYTMDFEDSTEAVDVVYGSYANPPLGTTYEASPSPLYVPTNQITQEFRFESAFKGPLQFITGVFYNSTRNRRFSDQYEPYDGAGDPAFYENVPHFSQELAAYVSGTWKPTDRIELSAGVREAYLTYFTSYDAGGWMNGGISNSPTSHYETATTPRFHGQVPVR